MILTFTDLETTGFKPEKGDRIIEVCMVVVDLNTRREIGRLVQRINPLRNIPEAATAVHGITIEDLRASSTWETVAPKVAAILRRSGTLIAHNIDFDGMFLAVELARVNEEIPEALGSFCTMEKGRWACPNGKNPSLGELCWALGVDYDRSKAHGAEYDVEVMRDCFFKGLDLGVFSL